MYWNQAACCFRYTKIHHYYFFEGRPPELVVAGLSKRGFTAELTPFWLLPTYGPAAHPLQLSQPEEGEREKMVSVRLFAPSATGG